MNIDKQTEIAWDRFMGYLKGVELHGRTTDRQRVLRRLDEVEKQVRKTRAEIRCNGNFTSCCSCCQHA